MQCCQVSKIEKKEMNLKKKFDKFMNTNMSTFGSTQFLDRH